MLDPQQAKYLFVLIVPSLGMITAFVIMVFIIIRRGSNQKRYQQACMEQYEQIGTAPIPRRIGVPPAPPPALSEVDENVV